jgi:hypothetical protein
MRRGIIAAIVTLFVLAQVSAFALCLLPCCAPVAEPCHVPEQQILTAHHAGHHAGMHHAPASADKFQKLAKTKCAQSDTTQAVSLPKVASTSAVIIGRLESFKACALCTNLPTTPIREILPPFPNAAPLRI